MRRKRGTHNLITSSSFDLVDGVMVFSNMQFQEMLGGEVFVAFGTAVAVHFGVVDVIGFVGCE